MITGRNGSGTCIMRSYPTGCWGREVRGNYHHWAIGKRLQEPSTCDSRHFRVYAEAAVELRLGALQGGMHDIAAQDQRGVLRPHQEADVTGCVPRPGLNSYAIVKGIVGG